MSDLLIACSVCVNFWTCEYLGDLFAWLRLVQIQAVSKVFLNQADEYPIQADE